MGHRRERSLCDGGPTPAPHLHSPVSSALKCWHCRLGCLLLLCSSRTCFDRAGHTPSTISDFKDCPSSRRHSFYAMTHTHRDTQAWNHYIAGYGTDASDEIDSQNPVTAAVISTISHSNASQMLVDRELQSRSEERKAAKQERRDVKARRKEERARKRARKGRKAARKKRREEKAKRRAQRMEVDGSKDGKRGVIEEYDNISSRGMVAVNIDLFCVGF